jgi:hypothetical protein
MGTIFTRPRHTSGIRRIQVINNNNINIIEEIPPKNIDLYNTNIGRGGIIDYLSLYNGLPPYEK